MLKKVVSLLFACLLAVGLLPFSVFANSSQTPTTGYLTGTQAWTGWSAFDWSWGQGNYAVDGSDSTSANNIGSDIALSGQFNAVGDVNQYRLLATQVGSLTLYDADKKVIYTLNNPVIDGTVTALPETVKNVKYYMVYNAGSVAEVNFYYNEPAPTLTPKLDVIIAEEKLNVGQEFTSNIVLKNTTGIYAEDFTIQYDNTDLEYLGFEEVSGYKVYNAPTDTDGKLRFVVASQGASYGINAETTFLKLKFKAKAVGIAKVDATKARIADTTTEFDLEDANCLEDTVIIENQDVNMSGEYTLLDLAIDAAHFGELGSTVDPTKYVANQVGDDTIRDEDLVFIVAQMLANTNYVPNNK